MLDDKAIVNAEDAVRSIRSGMNDEALMEKYEISRKGLRSLFKKLVAAGAIEQSVLDRRRASLRGPSWILSLRNPPRPTNVETEDVEPQAPSSDDRSIWKVYKHYFSAVGGALVGGVTVFLAMIFFGESGPPRPIQSATEVTHAGTAGRGALEQAEQLIRMLEAIANDKPVKEHFETPGKASDYDDCLNNCKKNFGMAERSDKALLTNCTRECMVLYAERIKEMRRRYYGNSDQD